MDNKEFYDVIERVGTRIDHDTLSGLPTYGYTTPHLRPLFEADSVIHFVFLRHCSMMVNDLSS